MWALPTKGLGPGATPWWDTDKVSPLPHPTYPLSKGHLVQEASHPRALRPLLSTQSIERSDENLFSGQWGSSQLCHCQKGRWGQVRTHRLSYHFPKTEHNIKFTISATLKDIVQ